MLALLVAGCDDEAPPSAAPTASTAAAPPSPPEPELPPEPEVMPEPRCPPRMVKVTPEGRRPYCVDQYEAMLVDSETGARISPYYAPSRKRARSAARLWESKRFELGSEKAKVVALPRLPAWELQRDFEPEAQVRPAVTPNGHVSGKQAAVACRHAGKRLCTWEEWRTACGGEQGRQFPYGEAYERGKCNVFRAAHPAAVLHDNPAIGHTDPRLNEVTFRGKPLLRKTGATTTCASRWGDEAIYDMVGNLDEWVDNPEGEFAGGFYARTTKDGCDWHSTAHPAVYADYSTGVRCCADLPE